MSVLLTRVYDFDGITANNIAATVTKAAAAGVRHLIKHVIASYDLVTAAGADRILTIAFTLAGVAKTMTVAVASFDSTQLGVNITFDEGEIVGDVNTGITITLAASGAADNLSRLNVWSRNVGNGVV